VQIAAALVVSVGLGFGLYRLLRTSDDPKPAEKATASAPAAAPKPEPRKQPANPVYLDSNLRLMQLKLNLRQEFGFDQFRFKEDCRPFLVALERGERYSADVVIKDYAARLVELYDFFRREFSAALELPGIDDEVLPVLIFSSRESFDAYTRRVMEGEEHSPEIRGLYEPTRGRIVLYHDPMGPYEVILHEGTHQLVHYYTKRLSKGEAGSMTQWFHEGLGTYFEGFRRTGDGQILLDPARHRVRLPAVKQAITDPSRTYTPLKVLTGMTVDGWWSWFRKEQESDNLLATRKAQDFYAQSWALVYFLRSSGGNYRRAFDEYFRLELQGAGGKEGFEKAIRSHLDMDLHQLEQKFIDFVRKLE